MNETITAEDIRRLSREVAAEVQAEVYGTAASTTTGASLPYATPPIQHSDLSLAVDVLEIQQGLSRAEASQVIVATGGDLTPYRDQVAPATRTAPVPLRHPSPTRVGVEP